jgi:hypothetical protein
LVVDLSSALLVMAPLRGAKRRKRQPEKASPAQAPPMKPLISDDWWGTFSRRLAAGISVLRSVFNLPRLRAPCALCRIRT